MSWVAATIWAKCQVSKAGGGADGWGGGEVLICLLLTALSCLRLPDFSGVIGNKIVTLPPENPKCCHCNLTQDCTCDNNGVSILPANKMSCFEDPEEILDCKGVFGALLLFYFG